jgi:hypothetical protein
LFDYDYDYSYSDMVNLYDHEADNIQSSSRFDLHIMSW